MATKSSTPPIQQQQFLSLLPQCAKSKAQSRMSSPTVIFLERLSLSSSSSARRLGKHRIISSSPKASRCYNMRDNHRPGHSTSTVLRNDNPTEIGTCVPPVLVYLFLDSERQARV